MHSRWPKVIKILQSPRNYRIEIGVWPESQKFWCMQLNKLVNEAWKIQTLLPRICEKRTHRFFPSRAKVTNKFPRLIDRSEKKYLQHQAATTTKFHSFPVANRISVRFWVDAISAENRGKLRQLCKVESVICACKRLKMFVCSRLFVSHRHFRKKKKYLFQV